MCDSVMCEDMAGYYKHGPALFYHLPATFSAPLWGNAATATFPTHQGFLLFNLHFDSVNPPPPPHVKEKLHL